VNKNEILYLQTFPTWLEKKINFLYN